MNTTEKDIELFDSYMNDTMSDTDRAKFEERLQNDEAYRKAYELHSEIVLGIQRKELKAMLQEQEMQSSTDVPVAAKVAEGGRTISMIFKLAVAACFFIGVCFVGYDFWKLSSLGGDYIAQLEQPVLRGSGVEETLAVIHDDLQQGNYSEAQESIDKARELVNDEQIIIHGLTEEADEEILYHQQMLKLDTDELDWYQALLYAKTHKIFKAKKLLKQIAKSDSRYSEDAVVMLK